jgi:hypothetical protein
MQAYLARHVADPRNQLCIPHSQLESREPPPLWSPPTEALVERFCASAKYAGPQTRSKAGSKAGSKKAKKKRKRSKAGSKAGSVTSDGTDNGSCWSG